MSVFYNNYIRLCAEKGLSPSKVGNDIGLTSAAVAGWKKGAVPRDTAIKKICEYFNCDVQDLLEENKKTATIGDGSEISIDAQKLAGNREELKKLVDRLTDQEVSDYLESFRKTILGQ